MLIPTIILVMALFWALVIVFLYHINKTEFNKALCEQASRYYELEELRKKDLAQIYAKFDIGEEKGKNKVRELDGRISALQLKANEIEDKVAKIDSMMESVSICVQTSTDEKVKRTDEFRRECVEYAKTCGTTIKVAAEELGVPYSTLRKWIKKIK